MEIWREEAWFRSTSISTQLNHVSNLFRPVHTGHRIRIGYIHTGCAVNQPGLNAYWANPLPEVVWIHLELDRPCTHEYIRKLCTIHVRARCEAASAMAASWTTEETGALISISMGTGQRSEWTRCYRSCSILSSRSSRSLEVLLEFPRIASVLYIYI